MKNKKSALLIVLIMTMMLAGPVGSALANVSLLQNAGEANGDLPDGAELESELPPGLENRPFQEWFNRLTHLPDWIFDVDELPDWFYDLEEMPVWFYTIPRIPQWFYSITEIPDWFYIDWEEMPEGEDADNGEQAGEPSGGQDGGTAGGQGGIQDSGPTKEGDTSTAGSQNSNWGLPDDWEWPEGWEWLENVKVPQGWDHSEWLYAHGWPSDLELPPGFGRPPWPPSEPDNVTGPPGGTPGLPVTPENGEGGGEGEGGDEGEGEEPAVAGDTLDSDLYPFTYLLPDESGRLGSNVPMGMITDGTVRLGYTVSSIILRRDGEDIGVFSGSIFTQDGEYAAFLPSTGEQVFSFRILGTPVNDFAEYVAPPGFYIRSVGFEDEPELALDALSSSESYELTQDGAYTFTIASSEDDEIVSVVTITLDTTPPELDFIGWQEGQASVPGPVEFFADEDGVVIEVTLEGELYFPEGDILTEVGSYVITATDIAGNEAVYAFSIIQSSSEGMNTSAIWLIIIVALLFSAIAIYLIRNRMKAKVR